MKRLSLLLSTCAIAATSHAQLAAPSIVHNPVNGNIEYSSVKNSVRDVHSKQTANKGTSATSRWYSYIQYFDTTEADNSSSIALSAPYLWGDSSGVYAYSDGSGGTIYKNNTTVNMGTILDPSFAGFNNPLYYTGEMKITSAKAYALDSLMIWGHYGHNLTKLTVKDTLRVSIVYGNPTSVTSDIMYKATANSTILTRYGVSDSLRYTNLIFDSTKNQVVGLTKVTKDIILDTSTWGDTTASGLWVSMVGFTPISIPAGSYVSATFQFISGDPAFTPNDTVFSSTIGYKYNALRPYVGYKGTSTTPAFAPYSPSNKNEGGFKTLPNSSNGWTNLFIPMWFWSSSSTGSTLQFPWIDYHLTCATCTTVYDPTAASELVLLNKVNAFPDPTADELNITFKSSFDGNATVTLTNIVGQTVRTQSVKALNGQTSKVTFSTSDLSNGVYIYNVKVDGQTSTGRVVVSH